MSDIIIFTRKKGSERPIMVTKPLGTKKVERFVNLDEVSFSINDVVEKDSSNSVNSFLSLKIGRFGKWKLLGNMLLENVYINDVNNDIKGECSCRFVEPKYGRKVEVEMTRRGLRYGVEISVFDRPDCDEASRKCPKIGIEFDTVHSSYMNFLENLRKRRG